MPAVMTIMTKKAGPHRMGRVMGVLGVPMLVAPILGPILGGWLVDDVSWRWIFLINVPIGIVAIILAQIVLERDEPQPAHKLDWLGMALLSPGLTLLIFGLAESSATAASGRPSRGCRSSPAPPLIVGFLRHSWRPEAPLIDIRTFTHTRAGAAAVTFMLFAIAFFGSLLLIPLYYQTVRGASALEAGLLMAPQGFGAMITMPLAGKLTDRYGPNRWAACGIPLLVIGIAPVRLRHRPPPPTSCSAAPASSSASGMGLVDDADDDRGDAGGAGGGDRPHQHRDEHHPPVRRLDRDGDPLGPARLGDQRSACSPARTPRAASGFEALHALTPAAQARAAEPLAEAFAQTFVWGTGAAGAGLHPGAGDGARQAEGPCRRPCGTGEASRRARVVRESPPGGPAGTDRRMGGPLRPRHQMPLGERPASRPLRAPGVTRQVPVELIDHLARVVLDAVDERGLAPPQHRQPSA